MSGLLDASSILRMAHCKAHVEVYETVDSTNAVISNMLKTVSPVLSDAPSGRIAVAAASQTAGRGRAGRVFESPLGAGLYISLLHCPELSGGKGIARPDVLTAVAAAGVCEAIENVYGVKTKIKWVNDIIRNQNRDEKNNGRKVCGILTEAVTSPASGNIWAAIIGIGVNVLPGALPLELSNVAGAILDDANYAPRLNELSAAVIDNVYGILEGGDDAAAKAMKEYKNRSMLINKIVTVHPLADMDGSQGGQNYTASVLGITDDAGLLVRTLNGEERVLHSGEVTLGTAAAMSSLAESDALSSFASNRVLCEAR